MVAVGAASAAGPALIDPASWATAYVLGVAGVGENTAAVAVVTVPRTPPAGAAVERARALLENTVARLEQSEPARAIRDSGRIRVRVRGRDRSAERCEEQGEGDEREFHCSD